MASMTATHATCAILVMFFTIMMDMLLLQLLLLLQLADVNSSGIC